MKNRAGLSRKYGPVWIIVAVLVFLFFNSTLPAIRDNRRMNREADLRQGEVEFLLQEIRRSRNRLEALENDPITVENELREQFGGAAKEGEIAVDEDDPGHAPPN